MKKLFVVCFLFSMILPAYSFDMIPFKYWNIVYGSSIDDVNEKLVASNVISEAIEPEEGTLYVSGYADPDFTWYNYAVSEWINVSFTTRKIDELFTRDTSLLYFSRPMDGEVKRITVKGTNFTDDVNQPLGQATLWVYRFYFYQDKLFTVSARYENNTVIKRTKAIADYEYANPGYVMHDELFKRVSNLVHSKFGGFHRQRIQALDPYTTVYYGGFESPMVGTFVSVFYGENFNGRFNFTLTFADNFYLNMIAKRFQKESYEPGLKGSDVPIELDNDIPLNFVGN